jgi:hypothetical protein
MIVAESSGSGSSDEEDEKKCDAITTRCCRCGDKMSDGR